MKIFLKDLDSNILTIDNETYDVPNLLALHMGEEEIAVSVDELSSAIMAFDQLKYRDNEREEKLIKQEKV